MRRSMFPMLSAVAAMLGSACGPSDRDLLAVVSAELATDAETRDTEIQVDVDDGVVRLFGGTNTRDEQKRAVEVTSRIPGVERVVNELGISDTAIARAVRIALAADPQIGRIPIVVEVQNGLVLLSSAATEPDDRKRAVALASRVEGVTRVGDLMR